ncbi:hypothetical protein ASD58_13455 [Duganella sp. Root1480D1]|nr:hypothetical protein ASD58_13455 [Duganella sp. Root1480D1]
MTDPARSTRLLEAESLQDYAERIRQLLDDRYAPGAAAFRQRFLGEDWSSERVRQLGASELVSAYLAAGLARRASYRVRILGTSSSRKQWGTGKDVTVSYRVSGLDGEQDARKVFSVVQEASCWKVQLPFDVYERISVLANALKEGRPEPVYASTGTSTLKLQLVAASYSPVAGMSEASWWRPRSGKSRVWVSSEAIATEAGIRGTSAYWSCDSGNFEYPSLHLLLLPAAAQAVGEWTSSHIGKDMALLLNGKVLSYAKIAGKLDHGLQLCMHDSSLEEVDALAAAIAGK